MNGYLKMKLIGVLAVAVTLISPSITDAYCNMSSLSAVSYGQSGGSVAALQQCLIDAGYTIPAGATGYFGQQTRTAVQNFYRVSLALTDWDGNSVGPIGRSKLAELVQGTMVPTTGTAKEGYKVLSSADELKKYLTASRSSQSFSFGIRAETVATNEAAVAPMAADATKASGAESTVSRVSDTNVQIVGIDEPDIVKTDGNSLFLSRESQWYGIRPMPMMGGVAISDMAMPYYQPLPTTIVNAFPLSDLSIASKAIKESGEMLLLKDENLLLVFARPNIVAYDIKDPKNPTKKWDLTLDDNTSIVTARLLDGKVYLVTESYINQDRPCPVEPVRWSGGALDIACTGILVPERIEPVSHLYTVMKLNTAKGTVATKTTVAGDYGGVTVMMSKDNLYIATRAEADVFKILTTVLIEGMKPYVPDTTIAKAETIQSYDISETGKLDEISKVLESYLRTLTSDERLRIENEINNNRQSLVQKHLREMYRSRIVRIGLASLQVEASGSVPGYLLNQFAMDEYAGHLRVAVTVDDGWGGAESMNDVYVLDNALNITGQIKDLGLSERIYSVRFVADKGYLVTFRQTDPFYVLDLSNASAPKLAGQLKIPGYSAYLEDLGDDLILGVGREGNGVKLSVFNVSNPANPTEKSHYQLKDYWSEVESNHRAFLRDAKHKVFFIPGGEGGYVFSYQGGELTLKKALSGYGVKRALYINDYLYIVSDDRISVLDETNWDELKTLSL